MKPTTSSQPLFRRFSTSDLARGVERLLHRALKNSLVWIPVLAPIALPLAAAAPAGAVAQGPYSLEVLVDGRPLGELRGNGRSYVQATAGHEYSLRLSNHTGRRLAVAVAVDGLNSIDAKNTTAREGSKWVLEPWETMTLDGWQTSSSLARRFYFTTERGSYGAWLGETDNLGIISAAFFREREPAPTARWAEPEGDGPGDVPMGSSADRERRADAAPAPAAPAPPAGARGELSAGLSAPAGGRDAAKSAPKPQSEASASGAAAEPSDQYAATGIGREIDHRVESVAFDYEDRPVASLAVRYEYRDALVKLGLLPPPRPLTPLERRERARGFAEPGFAPDPYREGGAH